jgi:hypothetical protein
MLEGDGPVDTRLPRNVIDAARLAVGIEPKEDVAPGEVFEGP